jgi:hypothetical protein
VTLLAPPPVALTADELVGFAVGLARARRRRRRPAAAASGPRRYELVWSDERVNAWLIRWSEDSDTGFHDHDASAAGIVVIDGLVVEDRLALHGRPITRRFRAGDSFFLAPSAIHRVRHDGGAPAVTIHAYSPPLRVQGVYRVAADGALERDAVPYTEELRAEPLVTATVPRPAGPLGARLPEAV